MLRFAIMFFEKTTGDARLICIDEGQDLTPNEYRLMKKINDGNGCSEIIRRINRSSRKMNIPQKKTNEEGAGSACT